MLYISRILNLEFISNHIMLIDVLGSFERLFQEKKWNTEGDEWLSAWLNTTSSANDLSSCKLSHC